jgi:putative resolvase
VAVYARVSSAEHRKNLDSQAERVSAFCAAKGWQVAEVVKECGSGVNDQRPQFLALLADTSISHIVVEHKDRCSRFGVAYIQTLLNRNAIAVIMWPARTGPPNRRSVVWSAGTRPMPT